MIAQLPDNTDDARAAAQRFANDPAAQAEFVRSYDRCRALLAETGACMEMVPLSFSPGHRYCGITTSLTNQWGGRRCPLHGGR